MQIIINRKAQSLNLASTAPATPVSAASALALCAGRPKPAAAEQQNQAKCNMLLELSAINNTNNSSSSSSSSSSNAIANNSDNDSGNYTTAIACKLICGCLSAPAIAGPCATGHALWGVAGCRCRRHLSCCTMSPSSAAATAAASAVSIAGDNFNYIHCAKTGDSNSSNKGNSTAMITAGNTDKSSGSNNKRIINNSNRNNNKHNTSSSNDIAIIIHNAITIANAWRRCIIRPQRPPRPAIAGHKNILNINSCLNGLIKWALILMLLAVCEPAAATLRNVNLYIEPPAVRRSQSATLRCLHTLEGAPLYSVKFYRGQLEFFRYTPGEFPNTKVFHYPGIKVDESVSNATQVVIRNVNFGLSGNYSCEVTADAPLFSTATAYAQMQVVEFPEKRPQLFTEHTRYEPGDVLRANCSTPPSRPKAELRFTINNLPVSTEETQYIKTVDNLIASRLSLNMQLQAVHFAAASAASSSAHSSGGNSNSHMMNALSPGGGGAGAASYPASTTTYGGSGGAPGGGALLLRCTAQIGDLYQEYKEIELGTPQRDPVPARVTSSVGGFQSFLEAYFGPASAAESIHSQSRVLRQLRSGGALLMASGIFLVFVARR